LTTTSLASVPHSVKQTEPPHPATVPYFTLRPHRGPRAIFLLQAIGVTSEPRLFRNTETRSRPSIASVVNLAFRRRTRSLPTTVSRRSSPSANTTRHTGTRPDTDSVSDTRTDPAPFLRELCNQTVVSPSSRSPLRLIHLLPLFCILTAALLQFILPRLQLYPLHRSPALSSSPSPPPASCPPPTSNPFLFKDLVCPQSPSSDFSGTLYNPAPRDMALAEQARKVAAEFEYSDQDVNRGTKEFVRQMSECWTCI